jgi:hypothetical protein
MREWRFITAWVIVAALPVMRGQDLKAQDPSSPRYRLTTIPTQFVFLELPIVLERSFGRHTAGVLGSYRPDIIHDGQVIGSGPYQLQNYWNFAYSMASIGILHKYYLRDKFGLHLETSLIYRRWCLDKNEISYNGSSDPFNGLRTEQQEVYIVKLLIGKSIIWKKANGPARVMEFHIGPSIRLKRSNFTTHQGIVDGVTVNEFLQKESSVWPALQLGLRYGIGM